MQRSAGRFPDTGSEVGTCRRRLIGACRWLSCHLLRLRALGDEIGDQTANCFGRHRGRKLQYDCRARWLGRLGDRNGEKEDKQCKSAGTEPHRSLSSLDCGYDQTPALKVYSVDEALSTPSADARPRSLPIDPCPLEPYRILSCQRHENLAPFGRQLIGKVSRSPALWDGHWGQARYSGTRATGVVERRGSGHGAIFIFFRVRPMTPSATPLPGIPTCRPAPRLADWPASGRGIT
jgi:hypothetical protein